MKPLARPSSLSFRLQLLLLTILGLAVDSCRSSVGILRLAYVVRIVCALGQTLRVVGSDVDGEAFRALDVVVDSNVLNYHPWSAWVPFEQIMRGVTLTYQQEAHRFPFRCQWQVEEPGRTGWRRVRAQGRYRRMLCRTFWMMGGV
jgi:hypothetical protein